MAINVLRGIAQQAVSSGIKKFAGNIRSGLLSAVNGDLPKTNSPVSLLQQSGKYTTKNFSFPIDVEAAPGMGNQGHYMIFEINKQLGATLGFGTSESRASAERQMKQAQKQYAAETKTHVQQDYPDDPDEEYSSSVEVQANRAVKNSTAFVKRRPTVTLDTAIALYMPPQVQVSYGADYVDTEIGVGASIAAAAYDDLQSDKGMADVVNAGLKKLGPELSDGLIRKALGAVDMIPGLEGAMEVVEMKRGFIRAPQMELAFKGIPKRAFSYDFKMMPKSAEEAEMIQKIILAFKTNMLPEMHDNNARRLKMPSTFEIKYMYNGNDNPHLHKISTCVLESMNVSYGGDRYKTYEGGVPVETSISLSFKEMDLITAEKAALSGGGF